jgi:eukaryotic-like serine/threonine-protein kinase
MIAGPRLPWDAGNRVITFRMRPVDPFIGRDILDGQFKILQKIGSGGMGSVYKAHQPAMNRMVGVKILHPKLANRKDLVSRFRREARAMSHLAHPNTTKVFLYGELDDGSLYIVMEFLAGKNLNQTVRAEGPFDVKRALPILIQVCGALDEAHKVGIIHRDMKPENIFLCQQAGLKDYAKVLDFGLAKVTEREMRPGSLILTQEGMVFGTPEFMSPEQAQGAVLTPASDIYSLAVILYEALTGKLPYEAKSPLEYIQAHVAKKPIGLEERIPGKQFPPLLTTIMDRALAKKPEDRFQTAAEFALAMQAVLDGRTELPESPAGATSPLASTVKPALGNAPTSPRPPPVSSKVQAPQATSPAAPALPPRGRRLRWGTLATIAAVCLILGAAIAVAAMRVTMP